MSKCSSSDYLLSTPLVFAFMSKWEQNIWLLKRKSHALHSFIWNKIRLRSKGHIMGRNFGPVINGGMPEKEQLYLFWHRQANLRFWWQCLMHNNRGLLPFAGGSHSHARQARDVPTKERKVGNTYNGHAGKHWAASVRTLSIVRRRHGFPASCSSYKQSICQDVRYSRTPNECCSCAA